MAKRLTWQRLGKELATNTTASGTYNIIETTHGLFKLGRMEDSKGDWKYHVIGYYDSLKIAKHVAGVVYNSQFKTGE